MKKIATIGGGVLAVILVAVLGAVMVMDDADLESLIASLPGGARHAASVVDAKRQTADGIAYWIDDTLYGLRPLWWDLSRPPRSGGPRVVIDLEPIRTPQPREIKQPAPAAATPVKLILQNQAAAPATSGPTPSGSPPSDSSPSEPATSESAPSEPPPSAAPAAEGAEEMPETAVAESPPPEKPAAPPAPPPAPATTTGDADHKRGLTFYKGLGVTKNFKTAAEWFEKAATKGHPAAQYNLGIISYLGQGRDQDYARAAEWFRMAAEQDHALAQYNLGFLYYEGKGVQKDDLQAFMWIDRAASLGDEKAQKARDTLAKILPKDIFTKQ